MFNLTTYPHLVGLFSELGVESERSDMSFALSTDDVEWGSLGLKAVFAQKKNLVSPSFLNMIREILKFGKRAPEVLDPSKSAKYESMTLGEYLTTNGYSKFFVDNYVVPMCAAIWSCSDRDTLAFPVTTLIRFWVNHHLLNVIERPLWRVVKGRSKAYVDAVCAALPDVRTSTPVIAVERVPGGVKVTHKGPGGKPVSELFEDVVFACHSDQALAILGDAASSAEKAALGAIKYQPNEVYLHGDESLMPRNRDAWASWNCLKGSRGCDSDDKSVCVSYWVNLLQNLPQGTPDLFVTLNPPTPPSKESTQYHVTLAHPLFNKEAIDAQKTIEGLQGSGGVWFCGAWCGYGFHEDGIRSAVHVADKMFGKSSVPWDPRPCDPHLDWTTKAALPLFRRVGGSWVPPGRCFKMILPNGDELSMRGRPLPPGQTLGDSVDGKPLSETVTVQVFDQRMFMQTVLRADIGFGESYMNGDFDCELYELLDMLCSGHPANTGASKGADTGVPSLGNDIVGMAGSVLHWLGAKMEFAAHAALSNTKEGSKKNIEYHYDAGNAFYKLFLDETMLYSSGIHQPLDAGPCTVASALGAIPEDDFEAREKHLESAQYAKIDAMIDRLGLDGDGSGQSVLEIGCGWGTCAIRMATRYPGLRVTGLTISNEQFAEARARVKAAGMQDRVDIVMRDYRDENGVYDGVISIEMLEAVGHEHLPGYFQTVSGALKPGGKAAIQVITMPDERYESYCKSESDFIRAYIFPGGHLPSVGAMTGAAIPVGLKLQSYDDIGEHYAVTLRLWRERMMHRAETVLGLGYSRKFLRMFEFYFAYCEAGFAHRLIHDLQMTWVKEDIGSTTVKEVKQRHTSGKSWVVAGIALCLWAVASIPGYVFGSDKFSQLIPAATAAIVLAHFIATVFSAALLVVITSGGGGGKDTALKTGESHTLLARASRLGYPFASCVASLGVGAAACVAVAWSVSHSSESLSLFSNLANAIIDPAAPAFGTDAERLAAHVAVAAGALAAFRLLAIAVGAGRYSIPGVTASAHNDHSARDAFVLLACTIASHRRRFLATMALASVAHVHAGAQSLREFARAASGFPHGDSSLRKISYPTEVLAFFITRFAPHLFALVAVAPSVAGACHSVLPRVARAAYAIAKGVAGSCCVKVAAERTIAELREFWELDGDVAIVLLFAGAAAATASNLKHLAQSVQERRAELAVRDRVIKLATSAEV